MRSAAANSETTLHFESGLIRALRKPITKRGGFIAKLALGSEFHIDSGDLDALDLSAKLAYLLQPFQRFLAPWFALTVSFAVKEFAASEIRDGTNPALQFTSGLRLSDRVSTRLSYRVSDRDA